MIKSIYLNLEDDIAKITARLKRERADEVVLVIPKRSFILSDSINLRLLKKQTDLLGKEVSVLTMDERGQGYAKEAGFKLKFLPKHATARGFSDVSGGARPKRQAPALKESAVAVVASSSPIKEIKKLVKHIVPGKPLVPKVAISENIFSDLFDKKEEPKPAKKSKPEEQHRSKRFNRAIVGFVALALIIILLLVVVILPKADVVVYARTEPAARDIEVSMSAKTTAPDSDKLIMPATLVDRTLELRDKFSSTGKHDVGNKAEGSVAIYNLTGKTINLKAATTTLTIGSKNYFFQLDQGQIKPSKEVGGQTPINIADIIAGGGGEDYNLPAGTRIEISNQVFGSKPQLLYAKTQTPVVGGTSRFISVVTADDIKKAQDSLTSGLVGQVSSELKSKNLIIPESAYTASVIQFTTDKQAGIESPNFEADENIHILALAFDQGTLSDLIRQRIAKSVGDGKNLEPASADTLTYKLKSADFANQTMTLTVHFESQVISSVSVGDIRPQISGKTKQEASEILLSKPEISRVDITLAPAWQQNLPRFTQKINIQVK